MPHFRLKDGEVTVARFDGERGNYRLAVGTGKTVEGPHTLNNYLWMEVDDWARWEETLIKGPFIHHVGMVYGDHIRTLTDAVALVPGLEKVTLNAHIMPRKGEQ
jgi:hypothetical protein